MRGLALVVALQDGPADIFDALMTQLAASADANLRGEFLAALKATREPAQQARLRALVLAADALRRNEIPLLLRRGKDGDRAARPATREWIADHFDTVAARVAPFAMRVVKAYADDLCSESEADALRSRFASLAALEVGKSYVNCRLDAALPHSLPWHRRLSERLGLFRYIESTGSHEVWFTDPPAIAHAIELAGRD